jgi:hypothetical protein
MDSHLIRELSPEDGLWATRSKTNAILADIFDMLAIINANLVAMGSHKRAKQPKPYERPGDKEAKNIKKYGNGAVTVPELEAFFEKKRKEHEARHGRNDRSSKSHCDDSAQHEGGSS